MYHALRSSSPEEEKWMRKILKKRLTLGASTKTINKVFPGLVPTFEVSLAQKFELKRIKDELQVYVEPKLDGIRCFAIVENDEAKLYARSGKLITNFDNTIGSALVALGDGCYDGELMGEDFIALMRQAYRKENVDQEGTYVALFDFLPLEEWRTNETIMTSKDRYHELISRIDNCDKSIYVKPVERYLVDAKYDEIMKLHNVFVKNGYEGAMVKTVDSPYHFGRSYDIMKVKEFHDVDLVIEGLDEGTGRHEGRLGAVVVDYEGTEVKVGSGFSDELRQVVWDDPNGFIGRMIEVRYQEVTPDGSLRFPTFVCFRNDR
jgi:DNA ligase-1